MSAAKEGCKETEQCSSSTYAPAFMVNRYPNASTYIPVQEISEQNITGMFTQLASSHPYASLRLATEYNEQTREVKLKFQVYGHEDMGQTQNVLNVMMIQDGMIDIQSNGGSNYEQGAREAEQFVKVWKDMQPYLDAERYEAMLWRFERQARDAWWWHDACILYFQQFAQRPVPADITPARFRLEDLMKYHLPIDNYRAPQAGQLP